MNFKEHLLRYLSINDVSSLLSSFNKKEVKGLILNTSKIDVDKFKNLFPNIRENINVRNAFIYDNNEYFMGSNIYHELGAYYISDPSASVVANLLDVDEDDLILDICAAPGGKTVGVALHNKDKNVHIIANDISSSRAQILLSNIERLGLDNVTVTSFDFKNIYKSLPNTFSKIILDAPCSGSGMFRKDEKMIRDWTYEKVIKNSYIQKELIKMCVYMLKEGGELIYSTCSYSYEEDEEVVKYILDECDNLYLKDINDINNAYKDASLPQTIHLFPFLNEGEGQYIAKICKKGNLKNKKNIRVTYEQNAISKGNKKIKNIYEISNNIPPIILKKAIRPGLFCYSLYENKEIIYSHHFARTINADNKNYLALNYIEAKRFIYGESISRDNLDDKTYFVGYDGLVIGVATYGDKLLKNHYPKGLRKKIIN